MGAPDKSLAQALSRLRTLELPALPGYKEEQMKASAIEFRFRMLIQVVIVLLGFWAPWIPIYDLQRRVSLLEWLALHISRAGLLPFTAAAPAVVAVGALLALLGALLRVWGTACLGYGTVHHGQMQGAALTAAGPYRYVRNPLYLGGWFSMLAIALLMPPTGALVAMPLMTLFLLRLILGEEAFLAGCLGAPYQSYLSAVPRLFPRLRATLPLSGLKPRWLTAILTEVTPIGVFVTFAFLSWTYDNELMIKGILVSFGLSLVAKAVAMSKTKAGPAAS
jgi:protein-S-isoprenylcysteine O-methyltransferase Ste14